MDSAENVKNVSRLPKIKPRRGGNGVRYQSDLRSEEQSRVTKPATKTDRVFTD
jgi:hypothetical protein